MHFKLLFIYHSYRIAANKLQVKLAIGLDVSPDSLEREASEIVVWIEPPNLMSATLADIERLAIARAREIMNVSDPPEMSSDSKPPTSR